MEKIVANDIAKKYFGITGTITPLAGERNPNFLVTSGAQKYVLKIHSREEVTQVELQELALAQLSELSGFTTPSTIPNSHGQTLVAIENEHVARMLAWIPGELWSQSENLSDGHKVALGKLIATVDNELASVDVTKYRSVLDRPFGWNALQVQSLAGDVELIKDADLKAHVKLILDRVINGTLAKVKALPHQLIHNDANDNNVVVNEWFRSWPYRFWRSDLCPADLRSGSWLCLSTGCS